MQGACGEGTQQDRPSHQISGSQFTAKVGVTSWFLPTSLPLNAGLGCKTQLPIPYTPPPLSSASLKKRSWLCPVSPDSSPQRKFVCPSAVLTLQTPYPHQSISVLLNPFWRPFSMPLTSGTCRGWQDHWHKGLLKICLHWKPKGLKREAVSAETSELFTYLLTTG